MKKYIYLLMVIFVFLGLMNSVFAEQKSFCDVYDTKITRMHSIETNNEPYSGIPKRLTAHEYKTLPQTWDGYCPACTLKDKSLCEQRPCQEHNIMPGTVYEGIQAKGDPWMKMASDEALKSVQNGGGPFGAVILQVDDKTGKIIRYWVNHNHVAEWNDPTAHAEVTVIRSASRELGVTDLGHINKNVSKLSQPSEWSHCVIYSSAESCPMCLAAIYWSGIKEYAFAATRFDAAVKGVDFSDEMIYEEFAQPYVKRKHMHAVHSNIDNSLDAFTYYKRNNVARYGAVS